MTTIKKNYRVTKQQAISYLSQLGFDKPTDDYLEFLVDYGTTTIDGIQYLGITEDPNHWLSLSSFVKRIRAEDPRFPKDVIPLFNVGDGSIIAYHKTGVVEVQAYTYKLVPAVVSSDDVVTTLHQITHANDY